jgi:hypothetical protein
MPRKRKRKELTWHAILSKRKEILLAMAVSGVTREDGVIKSKQTFKSNGGSNNTYKSNVSVQDILAWDHFDTLPGCWPKIIAEYAKPFIDGLTKRMAPGLYSRYSEEFAKRRNKKLQQSFRYEQRENERQKHGEDVAKDHFFRGVLYDYTKKPINQEAHFYIGYLRRKMVDPEFAKKFVAKYVIVPKRMETIDLINGRVYYLKDGGLYERLKGMVKKHNIVMFEHIFSLSAIDPIRPLQFNYNFQELVGEKCKRMGRGLLEEFKLVKYRNRLYLILT